VFDKADRDILVGKGARPFGELVAHCHRLSGLVPDAGLAADLKAEGGGGGVSS
jgi:hypothetical protein